MNYHEYRILTCTLTYGKLTTQKWWDCVVDTIISSQGPFSHRLGGGGNWARYHIGYVEKGDEILYVKCEVIKWAAWWHYFDKHKKHHSDTDGKKEVHK